MVTEKYVVDVAAPAAGEVAVVVTHLSQILGVDSRKVASLVNRLPDVVTRPISLEEATAVVDRFSRAGLRARVRRVDRESSPTLFDAPLTTTHMDLVPEPELREPAPVEDDELFLETDPVEGEVEGGPEAEPAWDEPELQVASAWDEPDLQAASAWDEPEADSTESDTVVLTVEDEPVAADPVPPVVDAPAGVRADAEGRGPLFETFEEVTPAELQARLRGTSVIAEAAAGADAVPARDTRADAVTLGATAVRSTSSATTRVDNTSAGAGTTSASPAAGRRRGSLQGKLLSTAIIPVLLTIVGALLAIWYTARPALYQQLLDSARNPAIATAASLSSAFEQTASPGEGGIDYLQLQNTILITRQAFPRDDVAFIIATDTLGNPLPGFFVGADSLTTGVVELQNAIRDRAVEAISLSGTRGGSSQLPAGDGSNIEIVAQPLMVADEPVGAIVVGVSDRAVTAQVNRIVINVLLFSLVPLLLAILFAYARARRLTNNVLTLTARADGISRGELEDQIEFRSGDELEDMAAALERMRVSMRGALERLRRRR